MEELSKDINFSIICSFLEKFGNEIDIPEMSFVDLERDIANVKCCEFALFICYSFQFLVLMLIFIICVNNAVLSD